MLRCERLTPALGAMVTGVTMGNLTGESADAIYDALMEH